MALPSPPPRPISLSYPLALEIFETSIVASVVFNEGPESTPPSQRDSLFRGSVSRETDMSFTPS